MQARTIKIYSDYKSPTPIWPRTWPTAGAGDRRRDDWLPYTLDIPAYLGSAKVDAAGGVLEESRNAHQWRRVKYSYMDCRREANRRGLTIRGTQKIFDSSLANIGMLYAKRHGVLRGYHDCVFERFWKRELDIESPAALAAVLSALRRRCLRVSPPSWRAKAAASCRTVQEARPRSRAFSACRASCSRTATCYWGREHLPRIREILAA